LVRICLLGLSLMVIGVEFRVGLFRVKCLLSLCVERVRTPLAIGELGRRARLTTYDTVWLEVA
jgi:hypothetical protein